MRIRDDSGIMNITEVVVQEDMIITHSINLMMISSETKQEPTIKLLLPVLQGKEKEITL